VILHGTKYTDKFFSISAVLHSKANFYTNDGGWAMRMRYAVQYACVQRSEGLWWMGYAHALCSAVCMRAEIRRTINFPNHHMSMTQNYFNHG